MNHTLESSPKSEWLGHKHSLLSHSACIEEQVGWRVVYSFWSIRKPGQQRLHLNSSSHDPSGMVRKICHPHAGYKTAICKLHTSIMFSFIWVKQVILSGLTSTGKKRTFFPKFHIGIEILVNKQDTSQTVSLQDTCILQLKPDNDIHQWFGDICLH